MSHVGNPGGLIVGGAAAKEELRSEDGTNHLEGTEGREASVAPPKPLLLSSRSVPVSVHVACPRLINGMEAARAKV